MAKTYGKTFSQAALTIIFGLVIALFFFGTIFSEKLAISEQEKRQLAKFPKFSWTSSSLEGWPKAFNEYLNDHFFHREDLVLLNSLPRVKFLHKSTTFLVLVGEAGWYFLTGDWALHDYLGHSDKTDAETTDAWEKLIALRQQRLQDLGANYLVAVAPNKESVYPEFLPERMRERAGTTMLEAFSTRMRASAMSDHFLDLGEALVKAKADGLTYFKTDTHWNERGAYFAYRAIMERIRLWYPEVEPLPEERFVKRIGEKPAGGDLVLLMGLKGVIPEKEEESWTLQPPCAGMEDKPLTSETPPHVEPLIANGCPEGAALRVLVVSDSFGGAIHNFIASTFQDVVFSREQALPDLQGFVAKYRPNIVLDLRVGRYLPKLMSPGPDEKI